MCDQEIVAIEGESTRATMQSADIILGEAANRTTAAWWIACVFARYPGCLVAAAGHSRGQWCQLAVRDREPELVRAGFGERLSRQAIQELALGLHTRLVTP